MEHYENGTRVCLECRPSQQGVIEKFDEENNCYRVRFDDDPSLSVVVNRGDIRPCN
jgi:hypothetical protein